MAFPLKKCKEETCFMEVTMNLGIEESESDSCFYRKKPVLSWLRPALEI